jgi:hypothetical protein
MVGEYFYHESNILAKIDSNHEGRREDFRRFKEESYNPYKAAQLEISGISHDDILNKIRLLSDYYSLADHFNEGEWINSQSKFRPTILEEFCGFLFKDIPKVTELGLGFYNKNIFAGLAINHDGHAQIKTKDIDFCIGKHFSVDFGSSTEDIIIPMVAIECKTYTDKTMLNEAQFAAQKLKQGSPNTKVYILSEGNQVKVSELPLKGQTPLDQMFVLREMKDRALWKRKNRKEWGELNEEAAFEFFTQVFTDLNRLLIEKPVPKVGKMILD